MLLMYSMRSHYKKYMGGIEDRGSRIEDQDALADNLPARKKPIRKAATAIGSPEARSPCTAHLNQFMAM
jgi:hypothetical protein